MGGNRPHDDFYAKVKFTIPSFSGHYDAEGYLDWEITVEQKFSAHLVPEQHRVRQATSEFKDFAIIWWTVFVSAGVALIHALKLKLLCAIGLSPFLS
jgi:hypothetical protein